MLSWALAFWISAIICAVFGFTGIASAIAKILFVVFVVLFLVSLIAGKTSIGENP